MVFLRHLQLFSLRIWRVLHISCLFKRLDSVHNFLRYKTVRVEKIDCVHITQDLTSSTILKGFKSVMRLNVLWKLFLGDNFGWFWKARPKTRKQLKRKMPGRDPGAWILWEESWGQFLFEFFSICFLSLIDIPVTMGLKPGVLLVSSCNN